MRRLRDDITLKEAWEWSRSMEYPAQALYGLGLRQKNIPHLPEEIYPDSFYEQPLVGSFGRFVDNRGGAVWGYLHSIKDGKYFRALAMNKAAKVLGGWDSFEPGLPQDVDNDGYPI